MNDNDYKSGVDLIARTDPHHPALKTLHSGPSALNCEYLKLALRKKTGADQPGNLTKRKLTVMKGRLYNQRAKLSNSFLELKTKSERAVVSDQIRYIQREIARIDFHLSQLTKNEETPPVVVNELQVPADIDERRQLIKSIQQKIYHAKKRIEKYTKEEKENLVLKNQHLIENLEKDLAYVKKTLS